MATFADDPNWHERLDWTLLQNGCLSLYLKKQIMAEDVRWLSSNSYVVRAFDCKAWTSTQVMIDAIGTALAFPETNVGLDALSDLMADVTIPTQGGLALVLDGLDAFFRANPTDTFHLLDIIVIRARMHLLFGRRLLALIRTDDPGVVFPPVGSTQAQWNRKEWPLSDRIA
jgi:hypothetical protein